MDSNSFDSEQIVLTEPGDLIAAVPHMLGFRPADSLVVLCIDPVDDRTITMVLRVDLPDPHEYQDLAALLRGTLVWQDVANVVLIVVGGTDGCPGLPYRDLLATCETHFAETGIYVSRQLWTEATTDGAHWRSSDCAGFVPSGSTVVRGTNEPVYARREDMAAILTPDDDDALARRAFLLAASTERFAAVDTREWLRLVEGAIDRAVDGILPESDQEIVALATSLCNHDVRDSCLAQPDSAHADAAERLWTALARLTPAPECAESACLLAFSAYQRGNGVLTGIALDCAEAADPSHHLSYLLRSALIVGHPPTRMRDVAQRASAHARELLARDGGVS